MEFRYFSISNGSQGNGSESNRIESNGIEWNRIEWNGMEWQEIVTEWSGMESDRLSQYWLFTYKIGRIWRACLTRVCTRFVREDVCVVDIGFVA